MPIQQSHPTRGIVGNGKLVFTAALNPLLLFAALINVGGDAENIFVGFKTAKDRYHNLVTPPLHRKHLDHGWGVNRDGHRPGTNETERQHLRGEVLKIGDISAV